MTDAPAPLPALRAPIDPSAVAAAAGDGWQLRAVAATGSTNADLASGEWADRTVLVADRQLAGRGRLGRSWLAPAGSGLLFSIRLEAPEVPPARRGWVGALLGLAVVKAIADRTGLTADLKWPNDVLINGAKCAGILAEMAGDAIVVGAGLNVSTRRDELPRDDATSLALSGATELDRTALLASALVAFGPIVQAWRATRGDVVGTPLGDAYRRACVTIGRRVRIDLPGGSAVNGLAVDVDQNGSIVVESDSGTTISYAAGDVVHLRPMIAD